MTVLDYVLMEIHSQLQERAEFWQNAERSGIWTSTPINRPSVDPRTYLDPETGKVLLGFNVTAYKFIKSTSEVCRFFIESVVSEVAGAGTTERKNHNLRNNLMSHLMPRSLYAITSEALRVTAFDELQRATVLRVTLYESSTRRLVECERPALGDSLTFTDKTSGR